MSIHNPVIELIQQEPRPASGFSGDALARRQREPSQPLRQVYPGRSQPGARLAWAAIGTSAGAVLALAGVALALVYLLLKRPAEKAVPAPVAATPSNEQQPATGSSAPGGSNLDFKGYILPVQPMMVSPKVSGTIVKLNIGEGCRVKKGDVLAELEDVDYKSDFFRSQWAVETARQQLTEAETSQPKEIGQAEAEMEKTKLELAQLQADFERARDLYYKQAASKTECEEAETRFRAAEQHIRSMDYALGAMRLALAQKIATLRTQLEQAEADLSKVRWRLECCTVRSPSSGTILKKNVEEGSLASSGASLCELANLSELEVEVPIPECEIHKIKADQLCQVRTEAFPDRVYAGAVSRVMPVANRVESAIPIRVKIVVPKDEEGIYLKPEMIARVSFLSGAATASAGDAGTALCQLPFRRPRMKR
jgi:HlyD family secretion protein